MIPPLTAVTTTTTTPDALQHRKLAAAAQQFEGMFLQQMLKPMSNMSKEDASDNGDDQAGDTSTYQSLGVESLARAISAAGGLESLATSCPPSKKNHTQNLSQRKI